MAAALSVGCGAAPQTGATETTPVGAEATESAQRSRPVPAEDSSPTAPEPEVARAGAEPGTDGAAEAPEPGPGCREGGEGCANPGKRRDPRRDRATQQRVADAGAARGRAAGERPAHAAAAAEEPPPQGPAAPVQGELVDRLFFARGSANLDDHVNALDAIAKVVRAGAPVTVNVIGGADEREPPGLARARAHGVRDALRARGVPASWIVIVLESPSPGPPSYDQKVDIRLQRP